ncbi:hypothetical protein [Teredinibacter turnerae]|uniref:hypothetical protein n=1 Tax=Teredinibacter turnerae TaxID=2426 RepID=UPI000368B2F1|nr:hypothetical protein [Teredinibacter turnerae]
MSLQAWQEALVKMVPSGDRFQPSVSASERSLSQMELRTLQHMQGSLGLDVTREVQRWWRRAKLRQALPYSCQLIERLAVPWLMDDYLQLPCTTDFHVQEAHAFLSFIQDRAEVLPVLKDLVRFESALNEEKLRAANTSDYSVAASEPKPNQTLTLDYSPNCCIASILNRAPLPDPAVTGVKVTFNAHWRTLYREVVL